MNRRELLAASAASLLLPTALQGCGLLKKAPLDVLPDVAPPPRLPQDALLADERAQRVAATRAKYTYDYSWPPQVAMPKVLPAGDKWTPAFLAEAAKLNLAVARNGAKSKGTKLSAAAEQEIITLFAGQVTLENLDQHLFHSAREVSRGTSKEHPDSIKAYADYFGTFKPPPVYTHLEATPTDRDRVFAWQRVAGPNPMMMRRASTLPGHFPVTEAHYTQAMGPGDSLAAAAAEGRLYLSDYALLDGAALGVSEGRQKYMTAPLALFAVKKGSGALLPVAIQCTQTPGPESPVFTPGDGWRWRMAMLFVQVADGNTHEAVEHLGRCHMVVGAVVMAMRRQLDASHPLRLLLEPHVELTLAINNQAREGLIAKGGIVSEMMAGTIEASLGALKAGMDQFSLQDASPEKELQARGVHDPSALPQYPYRADAVPLWRAIRDFVGAYVGLYYKGHAQVGEDFELQAFLEELGSSQGGRLKHLRPVDTVDELVELMANVVFLASGQHAAVNFAQFPFMGYVPNMPGAAWAPAPGPDTPDTRQAWLQRLPPWDMAVLSADTAWQLSNTRLTLLGDYPAQAFVDPQVPPLIESFKQALAQVDADIRGRQAGRLLPYPFLLPSLVPASIHI